MAPLSGNAMCKAFKTLHVPGEPLVLANVYDAATAKVVASMPASKVIATTSAGIAAALGVDDQALSLEGNLSAVRAIAPIAAQAGKALTVDMQDGYGNQLEHAIDALIDLGVAGVNLEDCDKDSLQMIPRDVAVDRITKAMIVAQRKGVPDFVINARIDSLLRGESFESVLARGREYLAAGATTVFVVDGPERRVTTAERKIMVHTFAGRLNVGVSVMEGSAAVKRMSSLGVARISVGPQLHVAAVKAFQARAEELLSAD